MSVNLIAEDNLRAALRPLRVDPDLFDAAVRERLKADPRRREAERAPHAAPRRRRRLLGVAASAAATVAAALLIVMTLFPSPSVGWDEVTQAIQTQKWIRGTSLHDGQRVTMWLSPERQVWAFQLKGSCYFFDGREKAKYEHRGGDQPITKLPLGEDSVQRVLPLEALSQNQNAIGPWLFGTEKVVQQQRREITDAGRTWIEFHMGLWRGEMNQATLRVDPDTRLPVYLLQVSPKDPTQSVKWEFDYPSDGPANIYALGVPREIKIDDRMPADEVQRVLAAMAASRARLGDFRLIVGKAPPALGNSAASYPGFGFVVSRKGNRWRVDSFWPQVELDGLAKGQDWVERFEEQLKLDPPKPLYVCDGQTVWKNSNFQPGAQPQWELTRHPAPQDLMSGEGLGMMSAAPYVKLGSLLFPDLSPKPGWGFEFDAQPADALGCVLLKRSARLATAEPLTGHEWYYIDPAKGHAVVRAELFNLPADRPADPIASPARQTMLLEGFQQSPQGVWYCSVVHNTMAAPPGNGPQGNGQAQSSKTTVRYHFDFDAELLDTLFTLATPEQ